MKKFGLTTRQGKEATFLPTFNVDGVFSIFENEHDAKLFLDHPNSRHNNIRFTFETERDNKISFLDILINKTSTTFSTLVYHKKTYTGLLANFFSFSRNTFRPHL